jgi:PIN domain nuclease of toxin-antitoxin system
MGTVGYLLDTHTYLWSAHDDTRLSNPAKKALADTSAPKFVSAASAYEVMNKYRLGKLPEYKYVAENYFDILLEVGVDELTISTRHTHFAGKFEWTHRDPFDRLLAAQAFTDNLTLITNDPVFHELSWITVLW